MELIRLDAKKEGVVMLQTLEEYCLKITPKLNDDEVGAFDLDEDYYDYENESVTGSDICQYLYFLLSPPSLLLLELLFSPVAPVDAVH
ncbi:hypothetical protein Tcan_04109 [Toxocara canis]|uniref:Uncharacterized protein n=1 Tax=Toxocara canis TaxID=6265 RepID=A0A0B2VRH6_TOXCA|nr:hypothetical protein Tcan_04109 [Toxocara canis]